jgi:DnaJ-class molecular chaperone
MSSYIDKLKQALEEAKNPMITCPKCHGKGEYEIPIWGEGYENCGYETHKCELCYGTGKVTLEFYEDLQRGCRR